MNGHVKGTLYHSRYLKHALDISRILLTHSSQLETDPELLIPKACAALERYGHQVVIGNDLNRRKYEVVFVSRRNDFTKRPDDDASGFQKNWLHINPSSASSNPRHVKEIEEDIVVELVGRHKIWIEAASVRL
jgi:phosphopantothenate-cysteine ligase